MEPYFSDGRSTIYHGDCEEVLRALLRDGQKINLTVTSPPYNMAIDRYTPKGMCKSSSWAHSMSGAYQDAREELQYQESQREILELLYELSHDDGSLFYNHKVRWREGTCITPFEWVLRSRWKLRQPLIWNRAATIVHNAKLFPPAEEYIFWMVKGAKYKWNAPDVKRRANRETSAGRPALSSIWSMNVNRQRLHPVSFPIQLPINAVLAVTDPGDLVLDPFMGGGTTLLAASLYDRLAIGIEQEERYCETAAKVLEAKQSSDGSEGPLFD